MKRCLIIAFFLLAVECAPVPNRPSAPARPRHVVIVSIDGLRPEFYRSDTYRAPNLKRLAREGTQARRVEGIFPSMTYPSHASIVTGVYPAKHGIVSNTKFGVARQDRAWHWEAGDIAAKTLWQAAEEKGLTTAVTWWPSTVGARVDYLIPERWGESAGETTVDLLRRLSTDGLLEKVAADVGGIAEKDLAEERSDRVIAAAARFVIGHYRPNMLFVHLVGADVAQHAHGVDAPEVIEAVETIDGLVGEIIDALRSTGILDAAAIVIVGDHGFADVRKTIAPNVLFAKAGLIEIDKGEVTRWKAFAHASGGHCAIYLRDDGDAATKQQVMKILRENAVADGATLYTIIDRDRLDRLKTIPRAFIALEAAPGFAMQSSARGPFLRKSSAKGNHGYLPGRPAMATGLIAWGAGIAPGVTIDDARLVDIAPTVAALMDLSMPDVDGRTIVEMLLPGR